MVKQQQAFVSPAPRVLIVRTSALGDIVQGLPVLDALKRLRPTAVVAWLVEETFAELLSGHPSIDKVIQVRSKPWRRQPLSRSTRGELRSLRSSLKEFRPDVALDLMSNFKAALLARMSGAPIRVGLARAHRREPASVGLLNQTVEPFGVHAVARALSVLRPFGLEQPVAGLGGEQLSVTTLPPGAPRGPFAIIHPGAGWRNKELLPQTWARVGRDLFHQTGLEVVAVTGPGEEHLGAAIATDSEGTVRHLPVPGLLSLVALQRKASLVLAGDTGPLHLARSLQRPVVCVMGPTDPDRHGPWLAKESVVFQRLDCSFCHKRLDGPRGCLTGLSSRQIVAKARSQLSSEKEQ